MTNITTIEHSKKFTVIYYHDTSLELKFDHLQTNEHHDERIKLDHQYRLGKSIIAICDGHVKFINRFGDRVLSDIKIAV
jgi:hypothetical protein